MRKTILAVLLVAVTPAMAEQVRYNTVEGVWSTKEACIALKEVQSGKSTFPKDFDSYSYLRESGINGWEWGCDFVSKTQDHYGNRIVVASCSSEGDSWPDMFMLTYDPNQGWAVTSKPTTSDSNVSYYPVRCQGVK